MEFTRFIDLASSRLGGRAVAASDEFFAPKESLLKPEKPVFIEDKFTPRGKWMDGWETRRRRSPGHDWCVVALAARGRLHGAVVDTSFFTGNYPEYCALEACDLPGQATARALKSAHWTPLLPKSALAGNKHNLFELDDARPWTHVRLNIFPDGGVARLRLHGEVVVDWARARGKLVDLAAALAGGRVVAQSDMHYGHAGNMLLPGRARTMGDGWETKRRRGPGNDWAVIKLAATGSIEAVEIDTSHFKGNYPESCLIEGAYLVGPDAELPAAASVDWHALAPRVALKPHQRRVLRGLKTKGSFNFARISIFPDGGIARLRLYGRPARP